MSILYVTLSVCSLFLPLEGAHVNALCYSGAIQDVKSSTTVKLAVNLTDSEPRATALVSHACTDTTLLLFCISPLYKCVRFLLSL